jgi:hypothetical protein
MTSRSGKSASRGNSRVSRRKPNPVRNCEYPGSRLESPTDDFLSWEADVIRTTNLLRVFAAAVLWCLPSLLSAETPLRETIDSQIRSVWDREKIVSASPADEATFLRRIFLDLAGVIPTHDEAKAFFDDAGDQKRTKLIDRLLDDPRYARHQADVWDMIYFGRNPPGYDAPKREGFQTWLREAFIKNLPYDQLARALLRAEGNTAEQGAPMYLAQYAGRPEDASMAVSQTFLGVQLQCARCHSHPYEAWTQQDFFGLAAFFSRLTTIRAGKVGQLDKVFVAEMNTGELKFTGRAGEDKPGKTGDVVKPKFLLAAMLDEPDLSAEFKDEKRPKEGEAPAAPKFSRKDKLAEWVTAADNPLFARAAVNRVWAQFMGRGLVHPVDNMSESNPASHPELLAELAREMVAHQFDLKWLIREICNSRAYQLGTTGDVADAKPRWFEKSRTRPLSAEELLESWRIATGYDEVFQRSGKKSEQRFHGVTWDYVKRFFGEPNNGVGDFQGGLQEHLYLNNGELGRLVVAEKGGLLDAVAKSDEPLPDRVDRLFLSVLTRRPTAEERTRFVEYLEVKDQSNERVREAIWALMTCSEFRFNQ